MNLLKRTHTHTKYIFWIKNNIISCKDFSLSILFYFFSQCKLAEEFAEIVSNESSYCFEWDHFILSSKQFSKTLKLRMTERHVLLASITMWRIIHLLISFSYWISVSERKNHLLSDCKRANIRHEKSLLTPIPTQKHLLVLINKFQ